MQFPGRLEMFLRRSKFRNKTTDDVDVTLVVCHGKDSGLNSLRGQDKLRLDYYIIISRQDIYPTSYDNTRQSGIFKTVIKPPNAEVMEAVDVIRLESEASTKARNREVCFHY